MVELTKPTHIRVITYTNNVWKFGIEDIGKFGNLHFFKNRNESTKGGKKIDPAEKMGQRLEP